MNFILLRYIDCKENNLYWNISIDKIQNLYPNSLIYIIDDHSKYKPYRFFTKYKKNNLKENENLIIINSELEKGRGELLPYYYMYKYKLSEEAIFIHDTVFIENIIKINDIDYYRPLWISDHRSDNDNNLMEDILNIIKNFDNSNNLIDFLRNKENWDVIFGGMVIIKYSFLKKVFKNNNYLEILTNNINTRQKRMAFERIIGCLLQFKKNIEDKNNIKTESINGPILANLKWNTNYNDYKRKNIKMSMEKIWLGRKNKKINKNNQYLLLITFLLIIIKLIKSKHYLSIPGVLLFK